MSAPTPSSSGPPPAATATATATTTTTSTSAATTNPPRSVNHSPISPVIPSPHRPPLYAAQPLIGKPVNPPPPPPPPKGILFPANRGFLSPVAPRPHPAVASRPHPADQAVTAANQAVHARNRSPAAVMTYAGQARPYVFSPDHAAPVHAMRPPASQPYPQFAPPRLQAGAALVPAVPPKGVAIPAPTPPATAAQPKVAVFPTISSNSEYNNCKDRDKSREDNVVAIHDRKVRLSDGASGSLYALCRSWVRNGLPQENQLNFGDGVKLLPKPLPANAVDSDLLKKCEDDLETNGFELPSEQISTNVLLKELVNHSKRVRAQFRKERVKRIARYKQRLSLLLPPSSDMGRGDAAPRS